MKGGKGEKIRMKRESKNMGREEREGKEEERRKGRE